MKTTSNERGDFGRKAALNRRFARIAVRAAGRNFVGDRSPPPLALSANRPPAKGDRRR
jgi:hypothetical protein